MIFNIIIYKVNTILNGGKRTFRKLTDALLAGQTKGVAQCVVLWTMITIWRGGYSPKNHLGLLDNGQSYCTEGATKENV